jgi:hypothetical protein
MNPRLFFLSAEGGEANVFPLVTTFYGTEISDGRCLTCQREFSHEEGLGHAELEGGKKWPDLLGTVGTSLPLLSRRIIGAFRRRELAAFVASPVQIEKLSATRLRLDTAPSYFYLWLRGRILLDLQAAGVPRGEICPSCHQLTAGRRPARRLIPRIDTWDGADIFDVVNGPRYIGCTIRVIELAREERWTNCRFVPIDADQRHVSQWHGIDYLGKQWPPAEWYPPAPSDGKTLEQWLEQMRSGDYVEVAGASDALRDLEGPAVPALVDALEHGREPFHRFWAARALVLLSHDGLALPPGVFDVAEQTTFEEENKFNPHLFMRDASGRIRYKT